MATKTENVLTNDAGIPVPSAEYSLTVGPNGPILFQERTSVRACCISPAQGR